MDATGLESEFIKLSRINVRPCFACKQCVPDNICKVKDDFQELAEKIKTALTGMDPKAMDAINMALAAEIRDYEHMELVGQLTVQGNVPCIYCGEGDTCVQSGFRQIYGPDAKTSDYAYARVEDQKEVWEEAKRIGRFIGERLH